MQSALVQFYSGRAPDSEGRLLDDILAWDDNRLEAVHDYIQWLFPLPEPSAFNPNAPVLRGQDIDAFARDPQLSASLARALDRMLAFYGFAWREGRGTLHPAPGFPQRSAVWLHPNSHNHLRLTRILRSLTLLGRRSDAAALLAALEQLPSGVTARTRAFWRGALTAADPSTPSSP